MQFNALKQQSVVIYALLGKWAWLFY